MTSGALELRKWLVSRVAEHVGLPASDLDVTVPLRTLGLDSAAIAEIAADLSGHLGLEVSPTIFFEYPTIAALVSRFTTPMPDPPPAPRAAPPAQHDPIAIVGISARLPGADSVNAMWELLVRSVDPVGPVPGHRWRLPGTALTEAEAGVNYAGMLGDVASFDAGFFRITPGEAARMDPQQRLLLQGTWEALEDGGLVADALAGSRTGVYVGISTSDYSRRQLGSLDDAHALAPTGSALSVAANRVSYVYDFRGPSVAVDTACSSSLVATHLAVRDLRSGDCEAAVVGGVNLLIEPWASVALARAGLLSPRGRCNSFDASADGYVRAEGCLVVVLKRLAAAVADGDRIYATILGSHVNQDGRSNGLTAPSPAAQEDLLRHAYANAGVSPSSVQYVECQGTGTLLGDSVEAHAVGTVIGPNRDNGRECLIGSIKSNVGHMESAAGIAGLVKCALALHHGYVPGNLHFRSPNPHVDFSGLGLRVAATGQPWPGGPRFAGVSGMGFGGTNAHVVLGEAPPSAGRSAGDRSTGAGHVHVLPLSARHPAALAELTRAMAARLEHAEPAELPGIVAAASLRRTHHALRAAVTGASAAELATELRRLPPSSGQRAQDPTAPLIYLFPGQAEHDPRALLGFAERDARIAATLRQCDEILREFAGWSLLEVLKRDDASAVLNRPEFAQPAAVATHIALAAMWQGLGLRPGAVAGHGVGEVSAAVVAGVLSLPQAMRVAQLRGEVTQPTLGTCRQLLAAVGRARAEALVAESGGAIELAAVNAPASVVLSGDAVILEQIMAAFPPDAGLAQWLPFSDASHTRRIADAAGKLAASLAEIRPGRPTVPFWSTVTGQLATDPLDGAYWARNLSSRVEFSAACSGMLDTGAFAFIELGTRPTLRTAVAQLADQKGTRGSVYVSTTESQADPVRHVRTGLARLYTAGINPRWERLVHRPAFVALPAYPWRRERHWLDRAPAQDHIQPDEHPLLGSLLELPGTAQRRWQASVGGRLPGVLTEYRVDGRPVIPAAGYVEMVLAAGRALGIRGTIEVRNCVFHAHLFPGIADQIQTVADPSADGAFTIGVYARSSQGGAWQLYAAATVAPAADVTGRPAAAAAEAEPITPAGDLYASFESAGLGCGRQYRLLNEIRAGRKSAVAALGAGPGRDGQFVLDPRQLEGAFQLGMAAGDASGTWPVPTGIDSLIVSRPVPDKAVAWAGMRDDDPALVVDAEISGESSPAVLIRGLRFSAQRRPGPSAAAGGRRLWWYQPTWRRKENTARPEPLSGSHWLVVMRPAGLGDELASRLRAEGAHVVTEHESGKREHYEHLLNEMRAQGASALNVLYCAAGPGDDMLTGSADSAATTAIDEAGTLVSLATAASSAGPESGRLWLVTRGCQPVRDPGDVRRPAAGALWGICRVMPFEIPPVQVRSVDVDGGEDDVLAARVLAELAAPSEEPEVAWRDTVRFAGRIAPLPDRPAADETADGAVVRPGAAYLVSGGLDVIGLSLARWLSEHGAAHIGLLGPSAPSARAAEIIETCASRGSRVHVFSGDAGDDVAVARAVADLRRSAPLRGVIHAAGAFAGECPLSLSGDALRTVIRPEVRGAITLDAATAADALDWTIYCSSAASVLGSPGRAGYCAATAFLDAYAAFRRSAGRPTYAVNWEHWGDDGLSQAEGVAAIDRVLRHGPAQAMILASDLREFVGHFPGEHGVQRFAEVMSADDASLRSIGLGYQGAGQRPALGHDYRAPRNSLERRIAKIWQTALGFDRVGVEDGFFELGGDSVFGHQVILEVNRSLGVSLDVATVFECFTVGRLAELAEADIVQRLAAMSDEDARKMLDMLDEES